MEQLTAYQIIDCNKETVKKNFVVRQKEFRTIIDTLACRSVKDPLSHKLILGRRGSGKTTLLKRIEIEINKKLSKKYIPVNLAEEQASIYRLFDLWHEVIEGLNGRFTFQQAMKDYSEFDNEKEYSAFLYQQIHEFCTVQNKKIVLLLDNFDRIFELFIDNDNMLFKTLTNHNDVIIIATSTRMDKQFWQQDRFFYDLFRKHYLEALTIEEIKEILNQFAETANLPELKKLIDENPGKLQSIRIVTDNMPRTIQFLIQLIVQNNYADEGVDYVQKIMDNITPIFQERVTHLPHQLRKMVLEMAFIWEACTTKDLVEKCNMESKLISANLKTLSDRGIVDKIETDKRNLLYRISERFFNMWLIVTQGNPEQKRKAKWLRIFLENWYDVTTSMKAGNNDAQVSKPKKLTYLHTEILNNKALTFEYLPQAEDEESISFNLGTIYRVQTIYSEAEKYFLSAIGRGQVAAMFNLGNFYVNQNKFAEAEKYYLLAIEKGHISAMYNLGVLYATQDKFEKAEKYFLSAVGKGDADAMYNLGVLNANQEKFVEAESYYLLALENKHVSAMYNLGNLYAEKGKFAEAEKYYMLATENGHLNAMYNLGNLYANQNKFTEARKYYLLATENKHLSAMYNLANLYTNQGMFTEAEKYYLLAVENGNVDAMNNLGIIYYKQNKFSEAEKYYLLAVENGNANSMNNLGAMYYNQGKFSKAEKYYLLAIEKNHDNAFYNLASLYYQQNKHKEKALTYISQYEGCEDLRIIIELWNGIFNDTEKRTLAVIKEEPDALLWFIVDLFIHQQKVLVSNLFNNPDVGKTLQEKFKVLHYVSLLSHKKVDRNLSLKIPPEIKTTINEVTDFIAEKEKFYGYKK